jgi:hypothetical protein
MEYQIVTALPEQRDSAGVCCVGRADDGEPQRNRTDGGRCAPQSDYSRVAFEKYRNSRLHSAVVRHQEILLRKVAQICPRWNRVADWLREAERFSAAA